MSLEVLLVEDNPGDVRLTREAFRAAGNDVHLHVACDGVEAMAFLKKQGSHSDAPRPALILLDLNLPGMDGREVLARIKLDYDLKAIPTVILSASDARADIDSTYRLQANCYLTKPVQLDDLDRMVRCISDFWLRNLAVLSTAIH
jgi:two-component system, chemotaxis family, response regulator Rcp1